MDGLKIFENTESDEQRRNRLTAELKRRQEMVYRMDEAVRRILEVSTELHLTWHDLDSAVETIRHEAYISREPDGGNNQEPDSCEKPAVLKERLDRLEQKLQANRKNLSEAELETKYKKPYEKLLEEISCLEKCLGISGNHQ